MADFKSSLPVKTDATDGTDLQAQIFSADGSGDGANVDSNNDLCVKSRTLDGNANPITTSNPLPVTLQAGSCTDDFDTVAAVAAAGTSEHDFAPGSAGDVIGLELSASGCAKWELQIGAVASETTRFVWFTTAAQPSLHVDLPCGIAVGSSDNIKIIRTNRDEQAMDVYSTILFQAN